MGVAHSEMTSSQTRFRSWSMPYEVSSVGVDQFNGGVHGHTCLASRMPSSLRGIPSEAKSAPGSREVVLLSIDARVSIHNHVQTSEVNYTKAKKIPVTPYWKSSPSR
jgi:hypothetical protein